MIDYTAHMIARSEHEHMTHSLATVSDNTTLLNNPRRSWVSMQVGRLLDSLRNRAMLPGVWLKQGRYSTPKVAFRDPEHDSVPG